MKTLKLCAYSVLAALTLTGTPAFAYDWSVVAHVTNVEVTYFPRSVDFEIDAAAGACAVGSLLIWLPQGSTTDQQNLNIQAVLSALMTATASGKSITILGTNSGCTVNYLYFNA